jgi:hypothetical protein
MMLLLQLLTTATHLPTPIFVPGPMDQCNYPDAVICDDDADASVAHAQLTRALHDQALESG